MKKKLNNQLITKAIEKLRRDIKEGKEFRNEKLEVRNVVWMMKKYGDIVVDELMEREKKEIVRYARKNFGKQLKIFNLWN